MGITRTVPCGTPLGRYRQNLGDRHAVAEYWARNLQPFGKNSSGNFFFDHGIIYSYGYHAPLARLVERADGSGPIFVLHSTREWSVTTKTKHLSVVWYALVHCEPRPEIFRVDDVTANTADQHLANYKIFLARAASNSEDFRRTRKSAKKTRLGETVVSFVRRAMKYSQMTGLGRGCDSVTPKDILADWLQENEGMEATASIIRTIPEEVIA